VETLNPKLWERPKSALCPNPYSLSEASSGGGSYAPPPSSSSPSAAGTALNETRWPSPLVDDHETDVEQALDLLERLMHPESIKRITPRQALYHPFLHESEEGEGDDAFFPHPFGEGVCGEWHFVDTVTEEYRVRIRMEDGSMSVIPVMAGEGTAIGDEPCEFHRKEDFFKSR